MQDIPEEIQAMAWLVGQSQQIDGMMTDRNKELITDASTIKKGLNDYLQFSRQQEMQQNPAAYVQPPQYVPTPTYIPNHPNIPPLAPIPYFPPPAEKEDDGQLEFNLDPTKSDVIINLLEDISRKLSRIIKNQENANQSSKKGSSNLIVESGKAE